MNKNKTLLRLLLQKCNKTLFVMRITAILLLFSALNVMAETSYSQTTRISVDTKGSTVKEVLRAIEAQSEYYFLYNNELIDVNRKVNVSFKNDKITDILNNLFGDKNIDYVVKDRHIILTPVNEAALQKQRKISGKVTDHTGQLLTGVTVNIKGTTKSITTDANGNYSIAVNDKDKILVFSFIGMVRKEIAIGNQSIIDVIMDSEITKLDEVVVIGYGTQKKISLTNSIETVTSKQIENVAVPSVLNILQGTAAGLNIQQTDANPGYSSTSIDIRGSSTLSNNPVLYIVDGMAVNDLGYLNPADIASVSVLKDASATAIYGARASGGVLLVTTKKGKLNTKQTVQYSTMAGFQKPARLPEFVDAPEFVDLYNQAQLNDNPGVAVKFTPEMIQKYKSGELPSTNWLPYILNNQAIQQQHNLSISGGGNNVDYYISGGYLDQGGLIKNVDYKRYTTKINVNVQLNKRLKVGINSVLTKEQKEQPSYGIGNALQWSYIVPVTEYPYTAAGHDRSYRGGAQPNDIMTKGGIQYENDNTINTNFLAEFKILDNLVLNGTYGYNYNNGFVSAFYNKYPLYNDDEQIVTYNNDPNSVYKSNFATSHPTALMTLNYNKTFKKHEVKALLGYSQEKDRYDGNVINRWGFLTNSLDQVDAGSSDPTYTSVSGNASSYSIRSWFGRINYAFAGKYLLEGNARYDGSSVFLNNRYGFFPSVSTGWIISEEPFFKPIRNVVDYLKIRGSIGQVGNQNASGLYPWANTIKQDKYILNKTSFTTTYYSNSPNPDLTWEVKTTVNLGVDMTLLKNLTVSVDVFRDKTTGILRSPTVPSTFGISAPQQNVGKMQNQGFEVNIAYKDHVGALSYHANINLSDSRNKILDLGGTAPSYGNNPLLVGQSRWVWYGLQAEGLFQSVEEIANHATQDPRVQPGDIKFKDVNKDGKITSEDRVLLGQATPHYRYGISLGASYKGFDLSMLVQGVMSNLLHVSGGAQVPFFYNGDGNILTSQLDYWSPTNRDARYPILRTDQSINNAQLSSWWLFKAAYMRFKNVQLGYTLPETFAKKIKISTVRIYLAADNLFVITSKNFPKALDPEISNYGDGSNYPQVRNISIGLNVGF